MKKAVLFILAFVSGITHYAFSQCSDLALIQGEPGRGNVGEMVYFDIRPRGSGWDSIEWTALTIPPGISTRSDQYVFEFYGSPTQPGTFNYSVAGSSKAGCRDTVTLTYTYTCFPSGAYNLDPSSGNLAPGQVGSAYNQRLGVSENTYEIVDFRFEVSKGNLPPGLSLSADGYFATITGTPSLEGTYSFSISISLGTCILDQRDYSIVVAPTGCGGMRVISDYIGQEYNVGDTIKIQHTVSDDIQPPYTFTAVSLPAGGSLTSSGTVIFRPDHAGNYSYTLHVTNSAGCGLSFSNVVSVICFPVALTETDFSGWRKGQYKEQSIPVADRVYPPVANFQVAPGALPQGLSLSSAGILSGTPTEFGIFRGITITYNGLGGCPGRTDITLTIENDAPVKTLYLYSLCAQGDSVRNWKVHNQNSFNVNVYWETIYYNTFDGTFVAPPGDTYFSTPPTGGPNTIRIKWQNEAGATKSLVQPANNNLCNPPSCVVAVSVDFYHQGQTRDGSHVQTEVSNPSSVLGEPDANDNDASRAYSLGFDGFIIVQLNANLSDGPGKDLIVHEYSPNNPSFSNNPERAQVFASMNGINWVLLGYTSPSGCSDKMDTEFDLAGKLPWCRYVKVLDVSNRNARVLNSATCAPTSALAFNGASNGFDLDAITCISAGQNTLAAGRTIGEGKFSSSRSETSPIYPNPAIDKVTLDFSLDGDFIYPDNGEVDITIFDMSGTSVYRGNHPLDDQWKTTCDVSNLNAGLFLTRVNSGGASTVYKFVKK